jgi:hypothetical protein
MQSVVLDRAEREDTSFIKKSKAVLIYKHNTLKACRGSGGNVPRILNLDDSLHRLILRSLYDRRSDTQFTSGWETCE